MGKFGLSGKQWALIEVGSSLALVATLSRSLAEHSGIEGANLGFSRGTWNRITVFSLGAAILFASKATSDAMDEYKVKAVEESINNGVPIDPGLVVGSIGSAPTNHIARGHQILRAVR